MKYLIIIISFLFVAGISLTSGLFLGKANNGPISKLADHITSPEPTPLDQYTLSSLSSTTFAPGTFKIGESTNSKPNFNTHFFSYEFNPAPQQRDKKTTTGIINMPTTGNKYPIVLMIRGFVDQEIYTSGMGSQKAAEAFAADGYITIAPDFLGYADSSEESGNIFETRFQTYTTVLSLLNAIKSFGLNKTINNLWDGKNIFIWAHSNGGQIALTALSATGGQYPTTLWAPVTKPFPYSILYYTDEAEDGGKFLRAELAKFEDLYEAQQFSFTQNLASIKAPLLFHQGTQDDAVPIEWTDNFVKRLEKLDADVEYQIHIGANHNLTPSWNQAINQDLNFFAKHAK